MKEKAIPLRNHRTATVKISRRELCDLLLATTIIAERNPEGEKWSNLHDTLKAQLDALDAKLDAEEGR